MRLLVVLNKLFIIIFIFSLNTIASECLLTEALRDPKFSSNEKFWEEYGKLSAQKRLSDDELKNLIHKHGGSLEGESKNTSSLNPKESAFKPSNTLHIHSKAESEIQKLSPILRKKVDEFLELAVKPSGFDEIRQNAGRWHLEKLTKAKDVGDNIYTVRLNSGYRVLFERKDNTIEILRVNKEPIHQY